MNKCLLISVLLLFESCFGFSIPKVKRSPPIIAGDRPTEVYEVQEGESNTVRLVYPKPDKPTLREIIYYHVIETPYDGADVQPKPSHDEEPTPRAEEREEDEDYFLPEGAGDMKLDSEDGGTKTVHLDVRGKESAIDDVSVYQGKEKEDCDHDKNEVKSARSALFDEAKNKYQVKRQLKSPRLKRQASFKLPPPPTLPPLDLTKFPEYIRRIIVTTEEKIDQKKTEKAVPLAISLEGQKDEDQDSDELFKETFTHFKEDDSEEDLEEELKRKIEETISASKAINLDDNDDDDDLSHKGDHNDEDKTGDEKDDEDDGVSNSDDDGDGNDSGDDIDDDYDPIDDVNDNDKQEEEVLTEDVQLNVTNNIPRTFGMNLTMGRGYVWNDLISEPGVPGISFDVSNVEKSHDNDNTGDEVTEHKEITGQPEKDSKKPETKPATEMPDFYMLFTNMPSFFEHLNPHNKEPTQNQKPDLQETAHNLNVTINHKDSSTEKPDEESNKDDDLVDIAIPNTFNTKPHRPHKENEDKKPNNSSDLEDTHDNHKHEEENGQKKQEKPIDSENNENTDATVKRGNNLRLPPNEYDSEYKMKELMNNEQFQKWLKDSTATEMPDFSMLFTNMPPFHENNDDTPSQPHKKESTHIQETDSKETLHNLNETSSHINSNSKKPDEESTENYDLVNNVVDIFNKKPKNATTIEDTQGPDHDDQKDEEGTEKTDEVPIGADIIKHREEDDDANVKVGKKLRQQHNKQDSHHKKDKKKNENKKFDKDEALKELINNEQFWNWLKDWTSTYMDVLRKQIRGLVNDEVSQQIKSMNVPNYLSLKDDDSDDSTEKNNLGELKTNYKTKEAIEENKQDTGLRPNLNSRINVDSILVDGKEIPITHNTNLNLSDERKETTSTNDSSKEQSIDLADFLRQKSGKNKRKKENQHNQKKHKPTLYNSNKDSDKKSPAIKSVRNIFGNAIGSDKVTNIFIFYPNNKNGNTNTVAIPPSINTLTNNTSNDKFQIDVRDPDITGLKDKEEDSDKSSDQNKEVNIPENNQQYQNNSSLTMPKDDSQDKLNKDGKAKQTTENDSNISNITKETVAIKDKPIKTENEEDSIKKGDNSIEIVKNNNNELKKSDNKEQKQEKKDDDVKLDEPLSKEPFISSKNNDNNESGNSNDKNKDTSDLKKELEKEIIKVNSDQIQLNTDNEQKLMRDEESAYKNANAPVNDSKGTSDSEAQIEKELTKTVVKEKEEELIKQASES